MKFPLTTRYSDYDTKGHVNNAFYLTYFEAAKHLLWREVWKRDPDPPFVVAEATVRFLSPAMPRMKPITSSAAMAGEARCARASASSSKASPGPSASW